MEFVIFKIIEKLIVKLKGDNYTLDDRLTLSQLMQTVFIRFSMVLRGGFAKLLISGSGILFLGKGAKLISKKNIQMGGTTTLGRHTLIDARVRMDVS